MKTISKASKITKVCRPVLALAFLWGLGSVGCEYYTERPQEKTSSQESTEMKESERTIVSGDSETIKNLEAKINELEGQLANQDDTEVKALTDLKNNSPTVTTEPSAPKDPLGIKDSPTPEGKETEPGTTPGKRETMRDPAIYKALLGAMEPSEPSPPEPTTESNSQKVVGLKLRFQTGNLDNMGRDGPGQVMFDLCGTEDFDNPQTCFRARFSDQSPAYLTLDKGKSEEINFGDVPGIIDNSRKDLEALVYPDDFRFFRLKSDPANPIEDHWFVQGVELQIMVEWEGDFKTVYHNPCVQQWIGRYTGGGGRRALDSYSAHKIERGDAIDCKL